MTPTTAPGPNIVADAGFASVAAKLVRSYIDALIEGDDAQAHAALGGGGTLAEKAFVDSNTTIGNIDSRGSGASASVDVQLATRRGPVYEHFVVERNAAGPYIASHVAAGP